MRTPENKGIAAKKPAQAAPARKPAPGLAGINAAAEQGMEKVQLRNDFYRDSDKKLFIAAIASVVGLVAQSLIAFSVFTAKNERVYFATDKNGSIVQLYALGQPNQKDAVVSQWVANALVDTFSFNFTDYKTRLNESTMEWFTKEGAEGLLSALNSAEVIKALLDRKMILSLALESTPVLLEQKQNENGVWIWTFQVNGVMTYRTQTQESSSKVTFMVQVDRRSVMENADGLGISKVIMKRR